MTDSHPRGPADAPDTDVHASATVPASPDPTRQTVPGEPGERNYFPELDGLRFFAFALVYLFHGGISQWTRWTRLVTDRLPAGWDPTTPPDSLGLRIQQNGWAGVQIFFVLSGFLITMLLLREERRYGRIDLRAFWVRRILRIWPLYYLTLLLAVFALPWAAGAWGSYNLFLRQQFPAFLAFLGNWSMGLRGPPPNDATSILWSVCVEEQFYIACPLLLLLVPRRLRVAVLMALLVGSVVLRYRMAQIHGNSLFFHFNTLTHLDTLLSGVLLAFLVVHHGHRHWLKRLARWAHWPVLLGFLWIFTRPDLAHSDPLRMTFDFVALWALTAVLIAVLVLGGGPLRTILAYSRLVWLGKISYGLYMYHEIALWLGRRQFERMGWFPNKEILQTIGLFALTVGMAAASYYLFERPFLALKRAWTRVPSRPV